VWNLEYDFNKAYDEKSLDGSSFLDLFQKFRSNATLFSEWEARYTSLFNENRYKYFCALSNPVKEDYLKCVEQIPDSSFDK